MKINILKREFIKPCLPTPQNRKNYKISYIDELAPSSNIGILLFYSASKPKTLIIQKLEESLGKVLPEFYVLAGRYIKADHSIDCSDQGVEFVEAEAPEMELHDIIVGSTEQLKDLLPRGRSYQVDEATDPLTLIQITDLNRSGFAIGVSVSHRIFDTSSLETFVSAWSNVALGHEKLMNMNYFDESPASFPGRSWVSPYGEPSRRSGEEDSIFVCKRLRFKYKAIEDLKSQVRPRDGRPGVSKVLVVSAVIAKALIGLDRAKHGRSRDCYINQVVNMRGRTVPPLQKHSCGNLIVQALSCITACEEPDVGIQQLVDAMGDAIGESVAGCARVLSLDGDGVDDVVAKGWREALPRLVSHEAHAALFSDWSRFGFYEADFGWGKPVWVAIHPLEGEFVMILMGNRDGDGIEAWVHLNKNDVELFDQDDQIRLFTA